MSGSSRGGCFFEMLKWLFIVILIFIVISLCFSSIPGMKEPANTPTVYADTVNPRWATQDLESAVLNRADYHRNYLITVKQVDLHDEHTVLTIKWNYQKASSMESAIYELCEFALDVSCDMLKHDDFPGINIVITADMVDKYGNNIDTTVGRMILYRDTIEKINRGGMLDLMLRSTQSFFDILDSWFLHDSFRDNIT